MNWHSSCLLIVLLWLLPACTPDLESSALQSSTAVLPSPGALVEVSEAATEISPISISPSPTIPPATNTGTATAVPSLTLTLTPTDIPSQTPTKTPSSTPTPSITPWPTPSTLPSAPRGWSWQLHAAGIPVTHYIVQELSPDDADRPRERPYGLDDQALAGIDTLPRSFLIKTAYQGSGRLPNGDILQYAATRPPVERGLVPYRFLITPAERCAGHPLAGNGTCSVPLQTAATTWHEEEGPLIPVGSTIFIPELNRKIRINDVALSDGPAKIDLYTGTVNNYDYERPDGATIWLLTKQ